MNYFDQEPLTELELAILRLLAEGCSRTKIEQQLSLSRATLYRIMGAIRHKLHADSNTHSVTLALKQGLIELNQPDSFEKPPVKEDLPSSPALPWSSLTKREREIFLLLGDVETSQETDMQLARHLYIAEGTVKKHLQRIYRKLGVANRSSAALLAAQAKQNNNL